jgi:transcriptional regulator with XRE-family HTH domain
LPRTKHPPETKKLLKAFGEGVRGLREDEGLSQEDFAERVDVHRTYVGMIERAECAPTLPTIAAWAAALGRKPSELLRDVGL